MDRAVLWYATRGAGTVSLVLLTTVVVLGLLARLRVEGRTWPRFLSAALHRNLSLLTVIFLGVHVITAVVDPFTSLGFSAAVVPFGSPYRTVWLGLGTISLELMVAVILTSLTRRILGARAWRAFHWLAYASWPLAVGHGLGTGTDALSAWSLAITLACVATVLPVAAWRIVAAPADPLGPGSIAIGSAVVGR